MPNGLVIPGGVTWPLLAPDGSAAAPSYSFANASNSGLFKSSLDGSVVWSRQGVAGGRLDYGIVIRGDYSLGFCATGTAEGAADLLLWRDAANVLALKNDTNAQEFRVYGTTGFGGTRYLSLTNDGVDCYIANPVNGTIYFNTAGVTRLSVSGVSVTSTVQYLALAGSTSAPGYSFSGATSYGIFLSIPNVIITVSGADVFGCGSNSATVVADGKFGWASSASAATAQDLTLARLGAASLRQGMVPSATPVSQTFTIGEASRPGTDVNVGGSSGTLRSGLGTGTGTASSLLFQTPDLVGAGSTTQTYTTRLTVATTQITATVPCLGVDGAVGAPTWSFANDPNTGVYSASADQLGFACGGVLSFKCYASGRLMVANSLGFSTAEDVLLGRIGAASLRVGGSPSATPVAQTFTIGEASRPGTDLNIAGSNGTIRSGLGTGNAAGSSLIFQTPDPIASSTVAQTYGQRLSLSALGATFDIPDQSFRINGQVSGAGASAGTLTNAPAAGNPSFWLPINVGGTVYFFPGW